MPENQMKAQMTEQGRMADFIASFDSDGPEYLEELEKTAKAEDVPIIRRQTQSMLRVLFELKKPMSILEVGTATGFSALFMAEYMPEGCHITTIENYEKRYVRARENFERFGRKEQITLLEGDASVILKELKGQFDFIFMDAAKGQYLSFLPEVKRLLTQGGVLVSDNVLQEGQLCEPRFAVVRRNRTIYERMREYLYVLKHDPELETVILTLADGTAISVKK